MANDDKIDFDVTENKKSTVDRWKEYEAYTESVDTSTPDVTPTTLPREDTISSSSSSNNSDTTKKASNEAARFFSTDTLSRLWAWLSNPLGAAKEELKEEKVAELTKTGATPVGTPALAPPQEIDEVELKKIINEMLEIWSAMKSAKEDQADETDGTKKGHPGDLAQFLLIKYMIEQRRMYEESSKEHITATNRARNENKEYHRQLIATDKLSLDLLESQKTWEKINTVVGTTNTALTVGALAGYLLVNLGGAALTGGLTIPASLVGTLSGIAARTAVVAGVTAAGGKAYKAHLDYKQNLFSGESTTIRSKYDITVINMRDYINRVVGDYERSLGISKEMKELMDGYLEASRAVAAR